MSNLLDTLLRRGLITKIYPESNEFRESLRKILSKPTSVYTGFDATAPSLHVGNLATIVNSLYFQAHGHQVIFIIGDATTQIGDPSGHSRDRLKLNKDSIHQNANCIEETLKRISHNFNKFFFQEGKFSSKFDNSSILKEPMIFRNSEWYREKNIIDFVGDVFRDVRVGWLLHKKSIQERLNINEGLNVAEFCYQIFQAYDWLELMKRYNCQIQIGGNDQGGNIYTGHDLIKRRCKTHESIGLLAPLITVKGKKLGKSMEKSRSGIWLRPEQTSPFDLYQFFHRTPDNDVDKFLRVFSFYDDQTIDELINHRLKKLEDVWHCQRKLAEHVCLLVHGEEGLEKAKYETEKAFNKARS